MATTPAPIAAPAGGLRRSHDRVIAGVCAGIAERVGVDPLVVRLGAVVLAFVGGVGLLAYVAAWWLLPAPVAPAPDEPAHDVWWLRALHRDDRRTMIGASCLAVGALLALRDLGALFSGTIALAAMLVAAGIGVAWARTSPASRDRLREAAARTGSPLAMVREGPGSVSRLAVGLVLVLAGALALLAGVDALDDAGSLLLAVLVAVGGLALLFGPWAFALARTLGEERRQRIRSEERAAIAAELHDSVLQTLALIQRSAPASPADAVAMARRQERELRSWLYGDGRVAPSSEAATTLAAAISAVAAEVEADHGVEVEVVAVGDHPLDDSARALVGATREALVNAAKHAGVATMDCYLEVADGRATVFVRDRGIGFDPATVAADRRGIAESIARRLERAGGTASIASRPGTGTEVSVEVPLT